MHLHGDFQRDMAGWLKAGKVKYQETIREGIANAPPPSSA
jgi:NADPH-dependent curcumin reductase CurA